MGEMADMMIDGTCCQSCGIYLGDPTGYPRYCSDCKPRAKKKSFGPVHPFTGFQPVKEGQLCVRKWKEQGIETTTYRCLKPAEFVLRNNHNGKTDHLCRKHFINSTKTIRYKMRMNPKRKGYIYLEIATGKITEVTQESLKSENEKTEL
jgi:hypothetical protein